MYIYIYIRTARKGADFCLFHRRRVRLAKVTGARKMAAGLREKSKQRSSSNIRTRYVRRDVLLLQSPDASTGITDAITAPVAAAVYFYRNGHTCTNTSTHTRTPTHIHARTHTLYKRTHTRARTATDGLQYCTVYH